MPKEKPILDPSKDGICNAPYYGYQRDNPPVVTQRGTFQNWADCGYEMDAMILSQEKDKASQAVDNKNVIALIQDMEGPWGDKSEWKHLSRVGSVVQAHAKYCEEKSGKKATLRYRDGTWNEILAILVAGRAVGFCSQITSSGHFIVLVGVIYGQDPIFIVNDPYGNARSNPFYSDTDGQYVRYPKSWLVAGRCWGNSHGDDGSLSYFFTR